MHIVRALICALAALSLASPGFPADGKPQAAAQAKGQAQAAKRKAAEPQAAQGGKQEPEARGDEAAKPFSDCPDCPEMLVIPPGSFEMGSPADEAGRYRDEVPRHRVTLGAAFALGKTEVTQGQWRALMGNNPSYFAACGELCPVEQVTWNDAQQYLLKLSAKTGKPYRLPTEAEWEYAARAGTTTPFYTGNCIGTDEANYDGNYDYGQCHAGRRNNRGRTLPVGSFAANLYGLYDMHGNVSEWVDDCWHDDYEGAPTDGSSWSSRPCDKHVLRGGSWKFEPRTLGAPLRAGGGAADAGGRDGVRVARPLP